MPGAREARDGAAREDESMPSKRDAIALTQDELTDFLTMSRTAILVTNGPDGFPDPVAMWYAVEPGGTLWMTSYARAQKVVNIQRDSRASILIEDGERYLELRGAQLSGRVELVDDKDHLVAMAIELAAKYEGVHPQYTQTDLELIRERMAKRIGLRFHVERTASWDHRKMAAAGA